MPLRPRLVAGETTAGYMTVEYEGSKYISSKVDQELTEAQFVSLL